MDVHASRIDRQLDQLEQCAEAIDDLFQQALSHSGPSAFDQFLESAARLTNLSIYNAMLVKVQRPGAVAVATQRRWREMGGRVRRTAIPMVILQPFGPVSFVYEYTDVDGVQFPGADASSLFASGPVAEDAYRRIAQAALAHRIEVVETDQYGGLLAGTAEAIEQLPEAQKGSDGRPRWSIRLNSRHDLPTRFATLAHELGHIYCGHLGGNPDGKWPNRTRSVRSHAERELEAEAVCWLVCRRNGVTTRSREYLARLIQGADLATVSMFTIYMSANRVDARS
jgi:IrrE N-terminal-like domain